MCAKCNDTYLITCTDYVPYGCGNVPMDTTEVCDCLWENGCPKCGWEVDWVKLPGRNYKDVACTNEDCGWVLQ